MLWEYCRVQDVELLNFIQVFIALMNTVFHTSVLVFSFVNVMKVHEIM